MRAVPAAVFGPGAQPAVAGTAPFARHNAVRTQVARPHRARANQYKLMVADS
jgi:hypothetical protein